MTSRCDICVYWCVAEYSTQKFGFFREPENSCSDTCSNNVFLLLEKYPKSEFWEPGDPSLVLCTIGEKDKQY